MSETRKIVIVGGGSAGWISAALLDARLNRGGQRRIEITLVESAAIGRIGVGEATIPTLRDTLRLIGIDEKTFMRRTGATFKQAIRFAGWAYPPTERAHVYWHPFEAFQRSDAVDAGALWLQLRNAPAAGPEATSFANFAGIQSALCEAGRAPKKAESPDYGGPLSYAYHVDAEALADLLCEVAVGRGVRRIVDEVVQVQGGPDGFIRAVTTKQNGDIEGDLFIDCTGFAAVLIEKVLGVPLESYSSYLLCDRAVGIRAPHATKTPTYRPYTSATAQDSGWIWDIDLYGRRGVGYVYSSAHIDEAAAEAALRAHIGPSAEGVPARHLKMRVGRRRELWKGNCIAVGLSAGFIEPLESTGIYFIEFGILTLLRHFPFRGISDALVRRYNRIMIDRYDETRDFVVLHYCLSHRRDTPFWREVQNPSRIPDSLRERLDLWAQRAPIPDDCESTLRLFGHSNFEFILYGMDWRPSNDALIRPTAAPVDPAVVLRSVADARARAMADLPDHGALLRAIHGA